MSFQVWIIIDLVLIYLIILPMASHYGIGRSNLLSFSRSSKYINYSFCLCLIFCVMATFDGDWYHYKDIVEYYNWYYIDNTHLESFYCYLIEKITGGNYYLFRIIIWGSGLTIFRLALKRVGLNTDLSWFLFTVFSLLIFSYVRVSLGLSVLFLGYTYVIFPVVGYEKVSRICGVIIILMSAPLHKSMYVPIVFAFISFIPFSKWEFLLSIILYPLISSVVLKYCIEINAMNDSDAFGGANYLMHEDGQRGIGILLHVWMVTSCVVITFGIVCWDLLKNRKDLYNKSFLQIFHWCYLLVYSYYVALRIPYGGSYMAERFLHMIYMPLIFLINYLIINNQRYYKISWVLAVVAFLDCNYRIFYAYYLFSD